MPWTSAAMIGLNVAGSLFGGSNQNSMLRAQARANVAQAKASQRSRDARNLAAKAQANVARFGQSIQNNRALRAGGEQVNAMTENIGRISDQFVRGNVARQLQANEELGRVSAAAGWTGTGGSSVRAVEETLRRRNAIVEEDVARTQKQQISTMRRQRGTALATAIANMDSRHIMADLDYGFDVPAAVSAPSRPNVLGTVISATLQSGLLPDMLSAAGGLFGGGTQAPAPVVNRDWGLSI